MVIKSCLVCSLFLLLFIVLPPIATKRLRGVTLEVIPFLYVRDNEFRGYCADVLNEISNIANLNYSLYLVEDGRYGTVSRNYGPRDGMLKDLVDVEDTDFAIADLTVTEERKLYVDFTEPIMKLGISALIHKTNAERIEMFRSLAKQNRVEYGTVKGTRILAKFQNLAKESKDETITQMFLKMLKFNWLVNSAEEGVRRVKIDTYALIRESATNEFEAANDCDLTSIRDYSDYFKIEYAIALKKGSPYKSRFNFAIKQMEKSGIFDKLKKKHWSSICNSSSSLITIGTFLLLLVTTLLSIIVPSFVCLNQ